MPVQDVLGALLAAVGALAAGWVTLNARRRSNRGYMVVALLALVLNLLALVAEIVLIVRNS